MTEAATSLDNSQLAFLARVGSPAAYAATVSQGRWKMARHLNLINRKLLDVVAGKTPRLMVSMPPRHGKSELISRHFPAWFLMTNPDKRVILATYSDDSAGKWGLKIRQQIEEFGPELFSVKLDPSARNRNRFGIQGREGGLLAVGIGGAATGEGADLLIIDDPHKSAEEAMSETVRNSVADWFEAVATTRLQPGGSIVLIQTRWHVDDLAGRLLARAEESGEKWEQLIFPAIAEEDEFLPDGTLFRREGEALWPEQFSLAELEKKKRSIAPFWWQALYQQRPTQHVNAEWPESYFDDDGSLFFDTWPTLSGLKVMALDPSKGKNANKGDYSAIVWWAIGKDRKIYVDADLQRRPVEQLVRDAAEHYRRFAPHFFGLESNAWQDLLAPLLRDAFPRGTYGAEPDVTLLQNTIKKEIRIRRLGQLLDGRWLRFKRNSPGAMLLMKQLKEFPLGKHDDGPDALEMCLQLLEHSSDQIGERIIGSVLAF